MADTSGTVEPRIWTPEGFRPDLWLRDETPDPERPTIVPLGSYLAHAREAGAIRPGSLAVEIAPGEAIDDILPFLGRLPLVALAFPVFSDGRSYSTAALLRGRHAYRGTLRAVGEVLIDQIPLMMRMGVTEFAVTNETAIRRLVAGQTGGLPHHYQPVARANENTTGAYSWRRLPNRA